MLTSYSCHLGFNYQESGTGQFESQRKLTYFLTPAPAKVPRIEPENHDSKEAENDTSNASCSEIGKREHVFLNVLENQIFVA